MPFKGMVWRVFPLIALIALGAFFHSTPGSAQVGDQQHPKHSKNCPQNCVLLLIKGHRKKGAEKRPESMLWAGFPCANPIFGKIQRVKTQRAKTSENFAEEKNVRRRYFRRFLRSHFYWIL